MNRHLLLASVAAIAISVGTGGLAHAADMPVKAAAVAPIPFTWSGWYVGGHIGGGVGRFDFVSYNKFPSINDQGPVGGLQVGYNWQSGSIVWGIEGDVSAANFEAGDIGYSYAKVDLLSSLRGRLGMSFNRVLVYATGGGAYIHAKGASSSCANIYCGPSSNLFTGVVGGGIEYAITNNFTVRGEALDYLKSKSFSATSDTAKVSNILVGRLGVNYKF